jgi:hypothetical protein
VFFLFRWSLKLRPPRRLDDANELTPFVDDSARRLVRAPETPRRLPMPSLRAPHGRDPPS